MAAFGVSIKFTAVDKLTRTVKNLERGVKRFGKQAGFSFKKASQNVVSFDRRLNTTLKRLTSLAAIAGGLTIGAFLGKAATAAIDLDRNISAAAAKFSIFDRESDAFVRLEEKAREMGATTEFTAGQAAEGLKNLATAGFEAEQAMAGINSVLDLATATGSDLALSADVAGKTLSAFRLRSKDPEILSNNLDRVNDTLNQIIITSGYGGLDEILTTVGGSGQAAAAAGIEIEKWGAIVGTAVSAGIDASSAGTQLNTALSKLAKPTSEAAKLIKQLGITVSDSEGNFRDIFSILRDVERATESMGSAQKQAALATLFGTRSYKVFGTVLARGVENTEDYFKEIASGRGVTEQMATLMRGGLSGALAAANSAIEEVGISIQKTFDEEINRAIKAITDWARSVGSWIKDNKELIKSVANTGLTILKLLAGFKALMLAVKVGRGIWLAYSFAMGVASFWSAKALILTNANKAAQIGFNIAQFAAVTVTKLVTAAQWAWNAAMTANPIGLLIAAIAGLVAAIVLLIVKWKEVKGWVDDVGDTWWFTLIKMMSPVVMLVDAIAFFQDRWEGIKKTFQDGGFLEGIKAIGKAFLSFLLEPLQVILKTIADLTGFEWAENATKAVSEFRKGLDVGLLQEPTSPAARTPELKIDKPIIEMGANWQAPLIQAAPGQQILPALQNTSTTQQQITNKRVESIQRQQVGITINDETNRAEMETKETGIPIELMATAGNF